MGCQTVIFEPDIAFLQKGKQLPTNGVETTPASAASGLEHHDAEMTDEKQPAPTILNAAVEGPSKELLFRCVTCKRAAHYAHLPIPSALRNFVKPGDAIAIAMHHQFEASWDCSDCHSFVYKPEHILAWRPYPADAVEPPPKKDEELNIRRPLPREYLVKWVDRSFRRTQWVPHMWLVARHFSLLKNFLTKGPKVEMLVEPLPIARAEHDTNALEIPTPPIFEIGAEDSRETSAKPEAKFPSLGLEPSPDAERRVMPAWKTVHHVLDVLFWSSEKHSKDKRKRRKAAVDDANELDGINADPEIQAEYTAAFDEGEQPSEDLTETVAEYEKRIGREVTTADVDRVIWAFIKWGDLPYDECRSSLPFQLNLFHENICFEGSWDCPPRPGEFGYSAYTAGFERYVASRSVVVPIRKGKSMALVANRPQGHYARHVLEDGQQPELGQPSHLKLMPFQVRSGVMCIWHGLTMKLTD
jgi:chromodomain-helicase-DNA-binding protein 4